MFDIAIIGGGAAGFSAAITARQRNKSVCVIRPENNASWIAKAEKISNYPGMPNISGTEMIRVFEQQAEDAGVTIRNGAAKNIMQNGDSFFISMGKDFIEAKKVILATGVKQPKQIPGENAFVGKGVSYCGTCDGMLYKNKTVAVIAESMESIPETAFLSSVVGKVYLFAKKELQIAPHANIQNIDGKVIEITGDTQVRNIVFTRKPNGASESLSVEGVFIFRDTVSYTTLIPALEVEGNFIKTDAHMKTNIDGIYAAGDCTGEPLQIAKAVGEGNVAVLSAVKDIG